MPMHVYHNGYECYVAENAEEAKRLCVAMMTDKPNDPVAQEDAEGDGWYELDDASELGMWRTEEQTDPANHCKQSCAAWVAENGKGFLCSTEY